MHNKTRNEFIKKVKTLILMASTGFDSSPRPAMIFEEGPMNYTSVCFSLLSEPGLTSGDLCALQSPAPPGPCPALAHNYMLRGLLVCQGPLSVLLKISTSKRLIFRAIKSQQCCVAWVCPLILHPPDLTTATVRSTVISVPCV